MKAAMLYGGSALVIFWGIAHIVIPTKSIVNGFGAISADNRRIILMEWLMFTGARTSMVPMKLCPPIFVGAAVLFWLPTVI